MTYKKDPDGTPIVPVHKPIHSDFARSYLQTKEMSVIFRKMDEIAELLWLPECLNDDEKRARILRALEQYESLDPQDGLEGLLAQQMVATHSAALECLRRAVLPNQTTTGRDNALKQAEKLMSLYLKQAAALDKRRGKGQQKVTVEHVTVNAGGQAIVGNVESEKRRQKEGIENERPVPTTDAPENVKKTNEKKRPR